MLYALIVTAVATDLKTLKAPFQPGWEALALNTSAGTPTLQHSDDNATYENAIAYPVSGVVGGIGLADSCVPTKPLKRYVRLTAAGTLTLLGNL